MEGSSINKSSSSPSWRDWRLTRFLFPSKGSNQIPPPYFNPHGEAFLRSASKVHEEREASLKPCTYPLPKPSVKPSLLKEMNKCSTTTNHLPETKIGKRISNSKLNELDPLNPRIKGLNQKTTNLDPKPITGLFKACSDGVDVKEKRDNIDKLFSPPLKRKPSSCPAVCKGASKDRVFVVPQERVKNKQPVEQRSLPPRQTQGDASKENAARGNVSSTRGPSGSRTSSYQVHSDKSSQQLARSFALRQRVEEETKEIAREQKRSEAEGDSSLNMQQYIPVIIPGMRLDGQIGPCTYIGGIQRT